MRRALLPLLLLVAVLTAACSIVPPPGAPLGSEQNPVKLALAPSTDTQKAIAAIEPLTRLLTAETGLRFKLTQPTSYEAVLEAMGTTNLDVGWLPPLAYVVAHDRVGAQPLLASVRHGSTASSGQIVVRADGGIASPADLRGRRFAFVDESSVNGYLMPRALLAAQGIEPDAFFAGTVFSGNSDAVLQAISARRVEGGATAGDGTSATSLTSPDLAEQLRVIARTAPVPNETLCLRKGIPPELARKIVDGLQHVAASPAGAQVLHDLYDIDGLATVTDGAFEPIRSAIRLLDVNPDAALGQRRPTPSP
jgi:phosphonate transport system substrate-binding protein